MSYSKIYYETGVGSGVWTEDIQKIKIRATDTLFVPRFAEIIISDPDHAIQNANRYTAYKRIRIDDEYGNVIGVFRVEFIETGNDDENGITLVLQCRDYLQEFLERPVDKNFSGTYNTAGALTQAIFNYYRYFEIVYKNLAGGAFTVGRIGNWITAAGGGKARIIYDDTVNKHLVLTDVVTAATFINNAVLTEYSDEACGTATGVTAQQNGASIFNVDTSSIGAVGSIQTSLGNYEDSSAQILEVAKYLALQQAGYDFFADNGVVAGSVYYPSSIIYFQRGSRPTGGPAANGLTIEYNPAAETDQVKACLANYQFPLPDREELTEVKVAGVDEDNYEITSGAKAGSLAYSNRIFKVRKVQRTDVASVTDLNNAADNVKGRTQGAVQRGQVSIKGYPFYKIGGVSTIIRVGDLVHIHNSRVSTVDNTNMIVVGINYEEPPGYTTLDLMSDTYGLGLSEYTWKPREGKKEGTEPIPPTVDTRVRVPPPMLPATYDIVFTAVDYNDITWGAGTITFANGLAKSTLAGSLSLTNSNPYYIYYEMNNTTLQVTQTFGDAIGDTRALVAFTKRASAATEKAMIVPGTQGTNPTIAADAIYVAKLSAITADMGLLTAGEIRVGTGTLGSNFTGWRLWVDTGVGRMAGYQSDVQQWYSDTSGVLCAGGGKVKISSSGINIFGLSNALTTRATEAGTIQCYIGSDGTIRAGGGNVVLSSSGINIFGLSNGLTTRATEAGTIQCYVGSDGTIRAGGGNIYLSSAGITLKGSTSCTFIDEDNNFAGYIYGTKYGLSGQQALIITATHGAGSYSMAWLEADGMIYLKSGLGMSLKAGGTPTTPTAGNLRLESTGHLYITPDSGYRTIITRMNTNVSDNLSSSRAFGTVYQNTSNKPLFICAHISSFGYVNLIIGSTSSPDKVVDYISLNDEVGIRGIVPVNWYYKSNATAGSMIFTWYEIEIG